MAATDIIIKLAMEGASVVGADINQVQASLNNLGGAVSTLEGLLGTLGIAFSVGAFTSMISGAIEATASLNKMSETTGVAVGSLSSFTATAKLSDTGMDEVSAALVKLSKNMIAAEDGTGKQARAFDALGLSIYDETGKMKTADQMMLDIAVALQGFEQSAGLTTVKVDLLGKSSAQLSEFLADVAIKGDLVGKVTAQQSADAEEYERSLIKLKTSTTDLARSLGLEMLPALLKVTELIKPAAELAIGLGVAFYGLPVAMAAAASSFAFLTAATTTWGTTVAAIGPTFTEMAATSGIAMTAITAAIALPIAAFAGWKLGEWAYENFMSVQLFAIAMVDGTMTAWENLKYAGDVLWLTFKETASGVFASVGEGIAAFLTKVGEAMKLTGATQAGEAVLGLADKIKTATSSSVDYTAEAKKLKDQLDTNVQSVHDITGSMADEAIAHFASAAATGKHKDTLNLTKDAVDELTAAEKALAAEEAKATAAGDTFRASVDLKNQSLQQEIDLGRKLTDGEKEYLKLVNDVASGVQQMTLVQYEATKAKIAENTNMQLGIQITAEAKKQADEFAKATQATADALVKKTASMTEDNTKLGAHIMELALGKEGYEQYKISVMLADAAQLEATANTVTDTGERRINSAELLKQAQILRDRAALAETGIIVAEAAAAQKAWEHTTKAIGDGLGGALADAMVQGRSLWDAFKTYMINTILDGMIKNALSSVIQAGLNSLSGGMSTIFSSFSASINSITGGALNSITSAASSAAASVAGASAGTGAVSTGVIGGGAGAAAGTDLGLLGTGAGASAGGAGAGAGAGTGGGMGALAGGAIAGAGFLTGVALINAYVGHTRPLEHLDQGSIPDLAGIYARAVSIDQDHTQNVPIQNVTYDHVRFTDDQSTAYAILGDGIALGSVGSLADVNAMLAATYPRPGLGYAAGGDFMGGIRLVGERGPELELTGPSRIFDAQTTASMLRSGGATNDEVIAELAAMRRILASVLRESKRTADATNGNSESPMIVEVDT